MAKKATQKDKPTAPQKAAVVANKPTLNLAFHEPVFHPARVLPLVVILAAGMLLFTEFGIVMPMAKKNKAYAELGEKQTQLQSITVQLQGYDELMEQYGRYSTGFMTQTEISLVDRMQAIALIDNIVAPVASVQNYAINNNALTLNISGVTLEQTSALVQALEANSLVNNVTVYTAKADDPSLQAQVAMTVVLQKEGAE
jgi:hypothetical protein